MGRDARGVRAGPGELAAVHQRQREGVPAERKQRRREPAGEVAGRGEDVGEGFANRAVRGARVRVRGGRQHVPDEHVLEPGVGVVCAHAGGRDVEAAEQLGGGTGAAAYRHRELPPAVGGRTAGRHAAHGLPGPAPPVGDAAGGVLESGLGFLRTARP